MTSDDELKAREVTAKLTGLKNFLYDNPATGLREIWRDGKMHSTYDPCKHRTYSAFGTYAEPTVTVIL